MVANNLAQGEFYWTKLRRGRIAKGMGNLHNEQYWDERKCIWGTTEFTHVQLGEQTRQGREDRQMYESCTALGRGELRWSVKRKTLLLRSLVTYHIILENFRELRVTDHFHWHRPGLAQQVEKFSICIKSIRLSDSLITFGSLFQIEGADAMKDLWVQERWYAWAKKSAELRVDLLTIWDCARQRNHQRSLVAHYGIICT